MSAVAGLRSTTTGLRAAVFGGGGFVGRYVIGLLAGGGSQVVAPSRGCEMAMRHLKPMADLGGLALPAFEARDTDSIRRAVAGCDVVINLVGKASCCSESAKKEKNSSLPLARAPSTLHLYRRLALTRPRHPQDYETKHYLPSLINYSFADVNVRFPAVLARCAVEAGAFLSFFLCATDAPSPACPGQWRRPRAPGCVTVPCPA